MPTSYEGRHQKEVSYQKNEDPGEELDGVLIWILHRKKSAQAIIEAEKY